MVDLIFTGGTVVTVSDRQPEAEAVAIADGRIRAVGQREDVLALRTGATRVVDLGGKVVLPGFVEAHGHPAHMAKSLAPPAVDVRPFGTPDGGAFEQAVKNALSSAEPGTPVLFYGIDPLLQAGLSLPSMDSLDRMAPHNPVVVVSNSGHAAYGNSAMFKAAGISAATPDPAGAEYVRADGQLTGEVREAAAVLALTTPAGRAMSALTAPVGKAMSANIADNLRWAYQHYADAGFTTTSELAYAADLGGPMTNVARAADCPVRVRAYEIGKPALARTADREALQRPGAEELFAQVGMKLWADGSPWQGNIATSFAYLDTDATRSIGLGPDHRGGTSHSADELRILADAFDGQGWQLSCHVHGDDAVDLVLDSYEYAQDRRSRDDRRMRLEHCGAMRPDQFKRAAALGATVSLFIAHLYYWGDVLVDGLFGWEHGGRWTAARSALDAGLRISLHNDGVVTPPDPLGNICTAVTRRAKGSGRILEAEECITPEAAVRAQTIDAAWQLFLDDEVGSIEAGKCADLVVLSDDPRRVAPDDIRDIEVVSTYLGGRRTAGQDLE